MAQSRSGGRLVSWLRYTVIGAGIGLCIVAIAVLAFEVRKQLDELGTANSDNVQWTLSQLEVEFTAFQLALHEAGHEAPLSDVRRAFDIFYSRVSTVSSGLAYDELNDDPVFAAAVLKVRTFLDRTVPLIDGEASALEADLPRLQEVAGETRDDVRRISLRGLEQFARVSDARREDIADTMLHLGVITTALVAAMILFTVMLLKQIRVSERRAEEQELTATRLRTIISTSLDAVIVVDEDGTVREFNGAAERIFGYTRAEVMGSAMHELIVPEKYRAAHKKGMERYRKTEERRVIGAGRIEIEAMRKSGEVFPVELSVDAAGREEGELFVAYIRDITSRKKAEAELVEARDRALAGEKAKAEFLAVMSHEMRTPLNGLLGTLNLIRDTELTSEQENFLDIMDTSGRLLMHHVNDVLDISKYEAGKIEIARKPFEVDDLLHEIVDSQQSVAKVHGNELTCQWVGDPAGCVVGDAVRLRQILLNLVGNALKFTRHGSVTVEAETLTDTGAQQVEFRVIDTGIGISEDDIDRVFSDFETLDTTYGRQTSGTGLGLGIARRLAHTMGGEIGAESVEGEGSVFWVRLPLPDYDGVEEVAKPDAEKRRAPALDVLIVEDNRINRVVLRAMLEREGHKVTEAGDGEEGVAIAGTRRFDVILMDISMPVMDGVAATRAIRDGGGASHAAPILAVTAHALPADLETFRSAGMNAHLTKPITREALAEQLHRHVGSRKPVAPPAPAPGEVPLIDKPKIEELREGLGNGPVIDLLKRLREETESTVGTLRTRADDLTDDEVYALLHRLAGAAGTLGLSRLHAELSVHQTRARAGTLTDIRGAADTLDAIWTESCEELSEYCH